MKRILIYLFVLFSISAGAQTTTTTQWQGAPLTKIINRGVLQTDSAFINARRDTTFTPAELGVQVFREADKAIYVSIALTGKKWEKLGAAGSAGAWGSITGTLASQTDLQAALDAKQDEITLGTSSQYLKGDLSLGTFSTDVRAVGDAAYAQLGHTHTSSQVTDLTSTVRNLFSAGTGLSYNASTGQFSFSGGGSGSYVFSAPLLESAGTVSITKADASTNGYLSAADYQRFFAKTDSIKVRNDSLFEYKNGTEYARGKISATPDSFTFATRRYVDSSITDLSGDFINNGTSTQTANFNISGNGVLGGNLDVTGHGNFAENRVQHYGATLGGASRWYNTSGEQYAQVNPDNGGYIDTRRFAFNMAVGDPIVGADGRGYLYMKPGGLLYWSYNGTHTEVGTGSSSSTPTITTASTSQTLSTDYETWVFTGSSAATFTLPAISGDTGRRYYVKNRGTANLTLQRAGSDQLYNTSLVNSITILPGGSFLVQNDGTYWVVID